MTFHFFKGSVAWELQIGTIYFQLRLPARMQTLGIVVGKKHLPLFAVHHDPYGKWL